MQWIAGRFTAFILTLVAAVATTILVFTDSYWWLWAAVPLVLLGLDVYKRQGGHAARLGDLGRDLAGRQDAAVARLGALRQLDLDHLHLRRTGVLDEGFLGEGAVLVAAAEVARADVPHQAAARLAMVAACLLYTSRCV